MEQDMLAGKLAEVDAQLAGVHAKLQSAAQMESAELDAAIAQTREETEQCAHALAEPPDRFGADASCREKFAGGDELRNTVAHRPTQSRRYGPSAQQPLVPFSPGRNICLLNRL